MKKRLLLLIVIAMVAIICLGVYHFCSRPDGTTLASREEILNASLSRGEGWSIVTETEVKGYLIGAAVSTDGKCSLIVFEPLQNGKYRFTTSVNRDRDQIIIGGTMIADTWYDLIWFNGAQTKYAEVVYTIDGQEQEALRYNTADMEILCIPNAEKEYTLEVVYYDQYGNTFR